MHRRLVALLMGVAIFSAFGCGGGDEPETSGDHPPATSLDSFFGSGAGPEAQGAKDVRASANEGAEVVARGRVKDLVDGLAVFTLTDDAMPTCKERNGDRCPTPWDYCCEDPDDVVDATITVELRDGDGRPLASSVKGWHEIDHMTKIVAVGTVHRDDAGNVTLAARTIHLP